MTDELAARRRAKEPSETLQLARLMVRTHTPIVKKHRQQMIELLAALQTQAAGELQLAGEQRRLTSNQVLEIFFELLDIHQGRINEAADKLFNEEAVTTDGP